MDPRSTHRKLVVTADDFGLSKGVNEGISVAFRDGVVRNTSVLVNFPDVEESVAFLQKVGGLDVGIHLNLTCGPPVSKTEQVPTLVGRGGRFLGLAAFFTRLALGHLNLNEVRREWKAQVELGLELGCKFTSICSHQHVHMLPQLLRITGALAQEYSIPFIRLSRYRINGMFWPGRYKALALFPAASAARRVLQRQRIFHNDYILEIPTPQAEKGLDRLCDVLTQIPGGVYELVCHPGYVDDSLLQRDHYTVKRLAELEILTSTRLQEVFERNGMELTTYRALAIETNRQVPQL